RVTNTRFNESDFKSAIGYGNSDFTSVVRYNFNRLDIGIPEQGIGEQSLSQKVQFPKQAVDNHIVSMHNNLYLNRFKLDADFGYILNDRSEFEDSSDATLHMKLQTYNYDLKLHLPKTQKFESIAGIQGMFQENSNFGQELLIPDATTFDLGIFTTANYTWNKNVLQGGIRYDNRKISSNEHGGDGEENYFRKLNRSFHSFNASAGLKVAPVNNLTVRLNLASGFRAPNLAELTSNGVHEGTNRFEVGNVDLKNEQNYQVDLNIEYKGSHFEFFVNGFYNHITNYISTRPTGEFVEDDQVYLYVQDDSLLFGGEAGIHLHPHPLDWLHIESTLESVTGKSANGGYLASVPANNWTNTLRTEFKNRNWLSEGFARIELQTTFAQANVSGFETASDGYTLLNAGFGGQIKIGDIRFEANLNGNNLLDAFYIAHLSRLKSDGIANMGRNIVIGINFQI
ncbi:MAG TPA: TonB-dependent receptor, partial [Flavobacterium sp.]